MSVDNDVDKPAEQENFYPEEEYRKVPKVPSKSSWDYKMMQARHDAKAKYSRRFKDEEYRRLVEAPMNTFHGFLDIFFATFCFGTGVLMRRAKQANNFNVCVTTAVSTCYFLTHILRQMEGDRLPVLQGEAILAVFWCTAAAQEFHQHRKFHYTGLSLASGLLALGYFSSQVAYRRWFAAPGQYPPEPAHNSSTGLWKAWQHWKEVPTQRR
jgi:hypothetical protein